MQARVYKCKFVSSLSQPYLTLKTSSASTAAYVGLLQAENCPDGTFYCYATETDRTGRSPSTTGFYKLVSPDKCHVDCNEAFVDLRTATTSSSSVTKKVESMTLMTIDTNTIRSIEDTATLANSIMAEENTEEVQDDQNMEARAMAVSRSTTDATVYDLSNILVSYNTAPNNSTDSSISGIMKNVNKLNNVITDQESYNLAMRNTLLAFNKYKTVFPDMHIGRAIPYVFFTRPDINLFALSSTDAAILSTLENDPILFGMYKTDPMLLKSLTKNLSSTHTFNPFLSNMALSFDVSDDTLETAATGETYTGWRVKYGRHNIGYKSSGSFQVSYTDTSTLQLYKIHKAWIEYISKVYRGEIETKLKYIHEKRLDYACSTYYFLCAPDGETILYFAKYVGVFPTSAPTGNFSWSKGSPLVPQDISVTYEYSWKEDMALPLLSDFNRNAGLDGSVTGLDGLVVSPKYYRDTLSGGYTFSKSPFVELSTDASGAFVYKLKFME